MRPLTPEQRQKVKAALIQRMVATDPVARMTRDVAEILKKQDGRIDSMVSGLNERIDGIRVRDGYTPKKGKDYFTKSDVDMIVDIVLEEAAEKLSIPDISPLADAIEGKVDRNDVIEMIETSRQDVDVDSIIETVFSRTNSEKKSVTVKIGDIDGLEQTLDAFKKQLQPGRGYIHGGGDTVAAGTGITLVRNPNGTVTISSTVSGFTELAATGAVNSSNLVFTFAQVPSYIVADGVWFKRTGNNGDVFWSNVGTTVTMVNPPAYSIFGIA